MAKEGPTYDDLLTALARKEFSPLYLLYGEEDFLIDEAVRAIIEAALTDGERGFNLDIMDAGEVDPRDVTATASAFPMTGDRRVVVLRDAERFSAEGHEVLSAYVDQPSPTTCLVITGLKPDFRKKLFATIRRTGIAIEFRQLYEHQVPGWIAARLKRQTRTITPEACKLLTAYVGVSLRELQNEMEKLLIYLGARTEITADDVAAVVGTSKEYSVFELQKAIGARDLRRSMEIVERMIDAGKSATFIIVMVTSYFISLWKLHDLRRHGVAARQLAQEARINPFFVQEYLDALGRHSPADIERAFALLAAADEQIKTTSADHKQILQLFLVRFLGQEELAFS